MNRLKEYVAESIPDPIKLIFFFGSTFAIGYVVGDYGYRNSTIAMIKICEIYQPQ